MKFSRPLRKPRKRNGASFFIFVFYRIEAQRSGFDTERKKEGADMKFSRLLRKPRKRNGASFF